MALINNDFINKLKQALKEKNKYNNITNAMLPDVEFEKYFKPVNDDVKKAGVLVLFYPNKLNNNELNICYIKRAEDNKAHSSQIAFPGGKQEDADFNIIETALREANEEIGINGKDVNILGQLNEVYTIASNYYVYPIIGYINYSPEFLINIDEVQYILEIPFLHFLDNNNITNILIRKSDINMQMPAYHYQNNYIWGITAIITNELMLFVQEIIEKNKFLLS